MTLTDQQFMQRLLTEDNREAFDELVLRHRTAAVKFAHRYTGDYFAAEDIAQEALARLYVNRFKYGPDFEFRPFLLKIIRNLCIDRHRRKSAYPLLQLPQDLPDGRTAPEEASIRREAVRLVRRLLNLLNEQYKTALYLQEYEQMSYRQIARTMGLSTGQVRMLIYRARKKLRELGEKELKGYDI